MIHKKQLDENNIPLNRDPLLRLIWLITMDKNIIKKFLKQSGLSLPEFLSFADLSRAQFDNHMQTIENNKMKFTVESHKIRYKQKLKEFIKFKIKQLELLDTDILF